MKIQHWAIIFLIIILPFSIVCRNVIKKKILVLNDETRYNNIIDNATFDAVAQIKESGAAFNLMNKFSKNVPLNEYIMDASVDRFFNTLCVNFNLPSNRTQAESYFCRYIPAIIFIGYDGLFVYSCEETGAGYEFRLKPKIPYAYNYNGVLINFTLDNYVKIYAPSSEAPFAQGFPLADDSSTGTYIIGGYVGNEVDFNYNGKNDLSELGASTNPPGITPSIDPYALTTITNKTWVEAVRQDLAVYSTDSANNEGNLSYFLYAWGQASNWSASVPNKLRDLLITDGTISTFNLKNYIDISFTAVNRDFQYDSNSNRIPYPDGKAASLFHETRRKVIVDTIIKTLRDEFNEHNAYAHALGISYDFKIPNISRDQWNNSIDDVSVLSFIQGMPIGTDLYYNNYSLGGARLVQRQNIYCEYVRGGTGDYSGTHKVYHRYYCEYIPRDENGFIVCSANHNENQANVDAYNNGGTPSQYKVYAGSKNKYPNNSTRQSSGIVATLINEEEARRNGFYPCRDCCM